jgi:NAD(P) transhydrogenase subunit alpha
MTVTAGGVKVIGNADLASGVATTASMLLSRNLADTLAHFVSEDGALQMDLSRELDDALVISGRKEGKD